MSDQQHESQPITTYDDLIRKWFSRSKEEKDIFTQFIFLYISFTAFLTHKNPDKNDRCTINILKRNEEAKKYYTSLIQKNAVLNATIKRLISELKDNAIINVTRPNDPHWDAPNGEIKSEADWRNIVEYWYRVRNNLFHGHKAPDIERDSVMVEYAYLTLSPLMENFIAHDLQWKFD